MKNVKDAITAMIISVCYVAFVKETTGDLDLLDFFCRINDFYYVISFASF